MGNDKLENLLNQIAKTTSEDIKTSFNRPGTVKIWLHGSTPDVLIRTMLKLYNCLGKKKTEIFIGHGDSGYSLDVGDCIKAYENPVSRDEARIIINEMVIPNYMSLSRFQEFVGKLPEGREKVYLRKVADYACSRNSGWDRLFGVSSSDVEDILDATFSIPAKAS